MFARKKNPPPRKTEGGKALMAQMGFMTSIDDMVMGSPDDDDDDLEAELRALQGGGNDVISSKKKAKLKSPADLEKMINMSMKDVPSDEDISDTEDPELMAELEELMSDDEMEMLKPSANDQATKVSSPSSSTSPLLKLLEERITNYNGAIASSQVAGDSSKVRRYERGLKTLEDMLKQAKMNRLVSEADIPPPVAIAAIAPQSQGSNPPKISPMATSVMVGQNDGITGSPSVASPPMDLSSRHLLKPHPPLHPQPLPRTLASETRPTHPPADHGSPVKDQVVAPNVSRPQDSDKLNKLMKEKDLFKSEALKVKRLGENDKAMELLRAAKQFDLAIKALEEGRIFDESSLISFSTFNSSTGLSPKVGNISLDSKQGSSVVASPSKPPEVQGSTQGAPHGSTASLLEGLLSRLNKYKEAELSAKNENNTSKTRRMGRIVKQYEDAIKLHKKGQPVDLGELPNPPGFPPLQGDESTLPPPRLDATAASPSPNLSPQKPPVPSRTSPKAPPVQRQASAAHSRAEQQAAFLEKRQLQFKKAAVQAKSSGDLELAKKYMRMAKGFDQMIEASRSGLPVDLSQIPTPPGEDSDFVFVRASDVPTEVDGDAKEVYKKLQDDLVNQIKLSEANRDTFTKLGDISSANKFEKLREGSSKDLESLKNAFQHGDPVPRFHYETRQFSIVRCCPDLGDNDLEVSVVRGLNLNPPSGYAASDLHTYVRYEFPFSDTPQTGDTPVIKGTDSPEFNFACKLEIKRKSRSFLRMIKGSKTFKFDVYYRRGFLKGDKILGSVAVKLQPLEDKCVYHDSFDLMEGRKAVGGKLEIKIRIRDPFINKQVDETKEKWLVIDDFVRKPSPFREHSAPQPIQKTAASSSQSSTCLSVLMYEKDLLDQQIQKYQTKLKPSDLAALRQKSLLLQKTASNLKIQLQTGGAKALQDYLHKLRTASQAYGVEAKNHALHNSTDKVKTSLTKKTLVDKEIESVSKKLQAK